MQHCSTKLRTMPRGGLVELSSGEELTIGDLARRTGVPIGTIRSWESRHGFPQPQRQRGRHRRYTTSDVRAVLAVVGHREDGLSLEAAIRRASTPVEPTSVFAEVRRAFPALAPQVLSRGTLVAMSRAIEDECCARAAAPALFGAFQHESRFRPSYARWLDLARTATSTVVFADFSDPAPVREGRPIEVALPEKSVLNREWAVVCVADDLPACLTAVEQPGQDQRRPGDRRFEALWSVDPQVVAHASRVSTALADRLRPEWRTRPEQDPHVRHPGASPDLARASQLFDRMLGYLDARSAGRSPE